MAFKNVTVSEDSSRAISRASPLMPAVLMIEALTQVAAVLILDRAGAPPTARVSLRGVNDAKFRRKVVPGDRLRPRGHARACRDRGWPRRRRGAYVDGQIVAEAELLLAIEPGAAFVDPTRARASRRRGSARARRSGRTPSSAPDVTIGAQCRIGASVVIDGWTEIGDETQIYPMASIGLAPQDLKYRGERTRLTIGRRNIFREFVTINRGTAGGGGETTIGDNNLFMAYVHVAHDCHIGNDTIFGPHATLGGHVGVEDFANISAGSAVHQFCRVGRHAFIGGYSVVTKDALPFARTIGSRPARIFGVNTHRPVAARLHAGHDRAAASRPTAICCSRS